MAAVGKCWATYGGLDGAALKISTPSHQKYLLLFGFLASSHHRSETLSNPMSRGLFYLLIDGSLGQIRANRCHFNLREVLRRDYCSPEPAENEAIQSQKPKSQPWQPRVSLHREVLRLLP